MLFDGFIKKGNMIIAEKEKEIIKSWYNQVCNLICREHTVSIGIEWSDSQYHSKYKKPEGGFLSKH